jgi:hypothetical protein
MGVFDVKNRGKNRLWLQKNFLKNIFFSTFTFCMKFFDTHTEKLATLIY